MTMDQERREKDKEQKTEMRTKAGAGGLRGVKTKLSQHRICPRQQQKFRSTLDRWLLKPRKTTNTAELCRAQEDVEMADAGGVQGTSTQSLDTESHKTEEAAVSSLEEETQPLTPQLLEEDNPAAPASQVSAENELMQRVIRSGDRSEEKEVETCPGGSTGSVRRNPKITDFFSGTSSPGLPFDSPEESPEEQDRDEGSSPSDAKPDVTWLGTPISELGRMPDCGQQLPRLKNSGQHTVLIRV